MLDEHLGYVADSSRLALFRRAINAVVKPGDRVADVGAGSGVLGLLCLQAGAEHVYAIDSTAILDATGETFARAGLAERVTCIRGVSQQVNLPEMVDLVVCDHVGYFGIDYGILGLLQDARQRFLKPGGTFMPRQLKLQLAAIESEKCAAKVDGWRAPHVPEEFHWLRQHAVNTKHSVNLSPPELLGPPLDLGTIDFYQDFPDYRSWSIELPIERDGLVQGLAGWFDCELATGVWMSNSPLADSPIDRPQAFFPIEKPMAVRAGDLLAATVMVRPADEIISWTVEQRRTGEKFSHSTWAGMLLGPQAVARSNPLRVPHIGPQAQARTIVLSYCDGVRTAHAIEEAVLKEHPQLLPSRDEIRRFVVHTLGRDTR